MEWLYLFVALVIGIASIYLFGSIEFLFGWLAGVTVTGLAVFGFAYALNSGE